MAGDVVNFPERPQPPSFVSYPPMVREPTPEDMACMYAYRALVIATHECAPHDLRADLAAIEKLFADAMAGRPLDWDVTYPDGGVMRGA